MTAILYALLPVIVTAFTALLKNIPVIGDMTGGTRLVVVRFIAALLSFLGVIGAHMTTGTEIDPSAVQLFVESLMVFLGAVGTHELTKQKVVQ